MSRPSGFTRRRVPLLAGVGLAAVLAAQCLRQRHRLQFQLASSHGHPRRCGQRGRGGIEAASGGAPAGIKIGLITKTDTNPFFVKMKEGAQKAAKEDGVQLLTAAGKFDGDNAESDHRHREHDRRGREGHPDHRPATPRRSCPPIEKARAKGVLVIALDSPTGPAERHRRAVRHRQRSRPAS